MRRLRIAGGLRPGAWGAALLLLTACAPKPAAVEAPSRAEDVVLITVDTLRADAVGARHDGSPVTPGLDRLAAAGRIFERAHAHSVMTLPSHANLLTGELPPEHGVRDNGGFTLDAAQVTLAERLREAGFATGAFVAAYPLASRFGLDAGFQVYDDDFGAGSGGPFHYVERPGDEVVGAALAWWRAEADRRRFLWVHLFEPHAPYEPPEPFAQRFAGRPYLGEVATADAMLTPLLEALRDPLRDPEAPPPIVVFTSDHGESLGEHGEATHGLFAYEATLHVPLILAGPGVARGRDERWVRHVDLLPTILEALALPVPDGLAGRSLLDPAAEIGPTYFEALTTYFNHGWAPLRGILERGQKLIELPLPELYDLRQDPAEERNLFSVDAPEARRLAGRLRGGEEWPPVAGELAADEVAPLRSLGYLASRAPARESYGVDDDPKNLVELDRMINEVARSYTAGETRRAVELASELISQRPDMPMAYSYLATILLERRELTAALEVMRRARRRGVAQRDLLRQLGVTLVTVGRPAEAEEILEPLAVEGSDPTAAAYLALARAGRGRVGQALAELRRLVADHPESAPAQNALAYVAIGGGLLAEAERAARSALEADPALASAWNNLAIAAHGQGRPEEAVEAWQRALELDPDDLDALYNLGLVADDLGRRELARRTLERFLVIAGGAGYEREIAEAQRRLAALRGSGSGGG